MINLKDNEIPRQYYVVGGEFSSLNFHSFTAGTAELLGPYKNRATAEEVWREISEKMRHKASYRYVILEGS